MSAKDLAAIRLLEQRALNGDPLAKDAFEDALIDFWETNQKDLMVRDVLCRKLLPGGACHRDFLRWKKVGILRAIEGKKKTVADIRAIVAKETGAPSAGAIEQSCKRIERLQREVERLNEKLGYERGSRF